MLGEVDAERFEAASAAELGELLRGDEVDLALADCGWEAARLDDLLRELHPRREVPIILVADPGELSEWGDRATRRFHATLLVKPAGRDALAEALRDGLVLRALHRDHHRHAGRRRREEDLLGRHRDRLASLREALRQARGELTRLRAAAEAETRRRVWLLSTISHHLRTPVHEVVLCCHLLEAAGSGRAPSASDWDGLTAGLRESVAWLRDLVDDLVDIARLDLGAMPNQVVPIPLAALVGPSLDDHRREAGRKALDFQTAVEPTGAVVHVDPAKLARITGNLVSNAVKFTEAGEVRVRAATYAGDGLVLSVSDTGPGIAADKLAGIFDEFGQVGNPERDRAKGTGLGLALCRRLVSAIGGALAVRSEPGLGSTFTVTVPCRVDPPGVV